MPIYEYKCLECQKVFEVISTSSSDSQQVKCAKCGSARVQKTISASSFRINSGSSSIPSGALSGCSSKSGFS
jgi:putative FmdB family regulatory protein